MRGWHVLLAVAIGLGPAGCRDRSAPAGPLTAFESGSLWGFRDSAGRTVIAPRFQVASDFTGRLAAVVEDGTWRFIDRRGRILAIRPFIVDNGPDRSSGGLARFLDDGQVGYLDGRGEIAIPARFEHAAPFSEGLAAFCRGGRVVREGEYARIEGGRWGYIDKTGRTVIEARFDRAGPFEAGRARVLLDGSPAVIDQAGNVVGE